MTSTQTRLPLLLAITLALGMFIGQQLPRTNSLFAWHQTSESAIRSTLAPTIEEVLSYVEARYVDTLNFDSLKTSTIEHLLSQLDPHSIYITPEEAQAVDDDMSGGFEGIGIEYIMREDTLVVLRPLPGGPAEKAGLIDGDRIVSIDGTNIAGVKVKEGQIFKQLRGDRGTTVKLGIRRNNASTLQEFSVQRDLIPIKSVEVAYMLDDKTGYIKVNKFTAKTNEEFNTALRDLCENKHMSDLVLDLRDNPGGYLNEATELLNQLFIDSRLLVYTSGRSDEKKEYKSNGRAQFRVQNVAVLIDENSASASEIVAGAIQDHDRGWVIGRRSYGKGLVQEQYKLSDGGELRLTIARYYTPSGRCIQRPYKNNAEYSDEAHLRLLSGELTDASKIHNGDTTKYYTGLGRIVYGGGGITPDVFIPIDTAYMTPYFEHLSVHLSQFTSRWLEEHGKNGFPQNINDFIAGYQVSDEVLEQLQAYAEKQGVKRNAAQFAKGKNELKLRIKSRFAKALFNDEGMYRVLNDDDTAVEKALQILRSGEQVHK